MTTLRVGVVGLGRLAQSIHLPTLASLRDVEVAAVSDLDERRRAAAAERFGARSYADHRALIAAGGLDAVFVLTTPHAIAAVGLDTLGAGLATFLEKPPGFDAAETRALRAAAERTGAVAMVGLNRRFQPLVRRARQEVEANGPLVSAIVEFHPFTFEQYRRGGFDEHNLSNFHAAQSIHAVDLLCHLGGEVTEVYGQCDNHLSAYGDTFSALVRFAGGATGHVICNYTSPTRIERAQLFGHGALAILDGVPPGPGASAYPFATATIHRGDTVAVHRNASADDAVSGGYRQEVEHFLACVRAGRQPEPPAAGLADAVQTMTVIDAIRAGHTGPLARWSARAEGR